MAYEYEFDGVIHLPRNLTEDEVEAFDRLPWPVPNYEASGWTLQEQETELTAIDGRNRGFKEGIGIVIEQWAKPLGLSLTGRVYWEGDDGYEDLGVVDVKDNVVRFIKGHVVYPGLED